MAWNTLSYACGHAGDKQLYGKISERERIVASASYRDCPECRAAKAKATDQSNGLAPLTGSPKQIAWASEIRHAILAGLPELEEQAARNSNLIDRLPAEDPRAEKLRTDLDLVRRRIALLLLITQASWWNQPENQRGDNMQRLAEDIKFFESYEYGAMLHGYKFEEGWLEAGTWIRDVWRSQSEHPIICYDLDGSPYVDEEDVWYTFDASPDGVNWHCYSSHSNPECCNQEA